MPNRVIKESIRTSKTINELTDFQFRLWTYLITYADDYGRGQADPEIIKGFVFPRRKRVTETEIKNALQDLAGKGCINLYNVDGESYFYFPKWSEHQRIRNKVSRFPAPKDEKESCLPDRGESQQIAADCGELRPEYNTIQSESNTESECRIQNTKSRIENPNTESKKERTAASVEDVITGFTTDETVKGLLLDWLEVRKAKRAPNTVRAIELNLKHLNDYAKNSGMTVSAYLENIIAKGWQAFYPIGTGGSKKEQSDNVFWDMLKEEK